MARRRDYNEGGANWFIVLFYIIFGIYFINHPFQFITVPTIIVEQNKWIIFVGGILMLYGAFNYFKASRSYD